MKTLLLSGFAAVFTALSVGLTPLSAATATYTVSDVNDDGYGTSATSQNWTGQSVMCGFYTGHTAPYLIGAFRFTGISIPKNTTILHAYLRVQAYYTGTGSSSFTIAGEAYDSTSSFNYAPYIGARSLTSTQIAWPVASAWAEDAVYDSPDIKTVVQELVNRSGWVSGNALAIQLRNTTSTGGYQMIYSKDSAATYGASPAQLIIEYEGAPDVVISENYISGALNTPSLVPTYLNNPTMYYNNPDGICWATANADILAYWDRNAYGGVKYWNLIDNGTAPLLQAALPAATGHDEANVKTAVDWLAGQYYGLSRGDEDVMIEEFANTLNGLAFNATYHGPVSSTADRTSFLDIIEGEINAGRPISVGSFGTYFGGAHQIPVIGYKEISNTVNSTVYIHRNTGGTQSEHVNFYTSSWGNLDMDQIVPSGTPVDEYEAMGDNTSATSVNLNPDDIYGFRQTHNFSFVGDVDWISLSTVSGRQYTINTSSLGATCDTVLTLFQSDGITQISQDDNSGGEARASQIVWNCWTTGTYLIRVSDKVSGSGHAANYDLKVAYGTAVNHAPVITEGASVPVTMSEDGSPTAFSLTLNATDPDAGTTLTWSVLTQAVHGAAAASGTGTSKAIGYAPTTNWNGSDSFVVRVSDGTLTDDITVNVTVQAVNDPPVIADGASVSVTMSEDNNPTAFNLTLNATDPDTGTTLTWSILTQAGHGTATASGTGTSKAIGYAPTANWNGSDIFVVRVSDGTLTDDITVNETVQAVNDPPVIAEGASVSVTMSEDNNPTAFNLTLNATDLDTGTTLTWSILTQAGHGAATASGTGTSKAIGYASTANWNGTDSFVVRVSDGTLTDEITVNVTVLPVNDAPALAAIEGTSRAYTENAAATAITTAITVSDEDNASMASGSVQVTGNYQSGQDVLSYTQVGSIVGTWNSVSGTMGLSGNDTVANYQLALRAVKYANSSENPSTLTRTVTFRVNDGTVDSNTQTRNITVTVANDAPTLTRVSDLPGATEDMAFTISFTTLGTASDTNDVDGDNLQFRIEAVSSGTLTKGGSPVVPGTTLLGLGESLNWTPATDANGTLNPFTIKAWDGSLASATAVQVPVQVAAVNDAPIIAQGESVSAEMDEDGTPVAWAAPTVTTTDADDDTLTWSVLSGPAHGTAQVGGTGPSPTPFNYTPSANWNGTDSFVVQVADPYGSTDTITVNVTVHPRNDSPNNTTLPAVAGTHRAGQTLTVQNGDWNDNTDLVSGTLTFTHQWRRADDTAGFNAQDIPGATAPSYLLVTADNGKHVCVVVTATDDGEGLPAAQSTPASSTWRLVVNSAPIIAQGESVAAEMDEDGTPVAWAAPPVTATDADDDTLTWSMLSGPAHGTAEVGGTGPSPTPFNYTPSANWNGTDSFVVQVADPYGSTDTITVNVTVHPRNDSPNNTTLPAVAGTHRAGQTLTVQNGDWNDNTDLVSGTLTFTHQWRRADDTTGTNAQDIPGATAPSYLLVTADNGKHVCVVVTATDDGEGLPAAQSTPASSTWTLVANSAPIIAQGESVAAEMDEDGTPVAWAAPTVTATDADDDTLTWSVLSGPVHGTADVVGTGPSPIPFTYTPFADWNGTDSFVVRVSDGILTDDITVNVTVNAVNDPPTLAAISNPAAIPINSGAQTVNLSGISAGPNETQTLSVTAASNNPGLIPNPTVTYTSPNTTGLLSYTPVTNASGSAIVTVTVNDAQSANNITTRAFTVVVSANSPPTITSQPLPLTARVQSPAAVFTVQATGSGTLAYQWSHNGVNLPGATSATHTITQIGYADEGNYEVMVTDSNGSTLSNAALLTVSPDPIANGSFEQGLAAWTASGNLEVLSASPYVPTEGAKLAAFNCGDRPPNGVLTQRFASVVGETYTLDFDVGVLAVNTLEQRLRVTVESAGATLVDNTTTVVGEGGGTTRWTGHQFQFTATSNLTVLRFSDVSTATSAIDLLLDNVRVTGPPITPDGTAVHSAPGYHPAANMVMTVGMDYVGQALSALGYSLQLPAGWSYVSDTSTAGVKPAAGETGTIAWAWLTVPAGGTSFTVTLLAPSAASGNQLFPATAIFADTRGLQTQIPAAPNPLSVTQLPHTADVDSDWRYELTELLSVTSLYNCRDGTTRTGEFYLDGIAYRPGPGTQIPPHHSTDLDQSWRISLTELLSDISLYNHREGTVRTGEYHYNVASGRFAPGPAPSGAPVQNLVAKASVDLNATLSNLSGPLSAAGGVASLQVSLAFNNTETEALGVEFTLPSGWSMVSETSGTALVNPNPGQTGELGWAWANIPDSPVVFDITVNYPPATASSVITGRAIAADPEGNQTQDVLSVEIGTDPYAAWVDTAFTGAPVGVDRSFTGNPDFDGFTNLIEYALRLDPMIFNQEVLRLQPPTDPNPLPNTLELSYERPVGGVPGCTYTLNSSTDLVSWQPLTGQVIVPLGGGKERIVHTVSQGAGEFYILEVTGP